MKSTTFLAALTIGAASMLPAAGAAGPCSLAITSK
jgi:hypothetical protein